MPLVFQAEVATAFAQLVHAAPEAPLESRAFANVGTWTWAWMEPMIGTASFSILCLQLLRGAMINLACVRSLPPLSPMRARARARASIRASRAFSGCERSRMPRRYRPVKDRVLGWRANALADRFPQYDRPVVKDFGRSQPMRYIELGPGFRPYLKSSKSPANAKEQITSPRGGLGMRGP